MAKGKNRTHGDGASQKKHNSSAIGKQTKLTDKPAFNNYYIALLIILVLTVIVYLPSLSNGFVWDDQSYLETNAMIRSINLKTIFSTYILGNYHPLTMLIYAIEYHFF